MFSTFPSFKLSCLGLILAMVMSNQFSPAESLGKKSSVDQASLDMKALNSCNIGKLSEVKNNIEKVLAKYPYLATTLGHRGEFDKYLSDLKQTIGHDKKEHKNMEYTDVYYENEQELKDKKSELGKSIKEDEAKAKLLKQLMDNRGYQAFMSTYEICTERLEKIEGKNAVEAKRICDKYLGPIKQNFKEAGIDLDSTKKEEHIEPKKTDLEIMEDCHKLAEAGKLKHVEEEMREILKTYKLSNTLGNLEAFSQYITRWENMTAGTKGHAMRGDQVASYEKQLNMMKKLRNDNGYKTAVLTKEICAEGMDEFNESEKAKANETCKQIEKLFVDVLGKEQHHAIPEWLNSLKSG